MWFLISAPVFRPNYTVAAKLVFLLYESLLKPQLLASLKLVDTASTPDRPFQYFEASKSARLHKCCRSASSEIVKRHVGWQKNTLPTLRALKSADISF